MSSADQDLLAPAFTMKDPIRWLKTLQIKGGGAGAGIPM